MNPKVRAYAKSLLAISMENGRVSGERVSAVLETLKSRPPRNYKAVLETYLAKIRIELRKENAKIEYVGSFPSEDVDAVKSKLSDYYDREVKVELSEKKDLIAGFRILVADDVWDASIRGRLERFALSFKQ